MHSTTTPTSALSQDWTLVVQCRSGRGAILAAMVQALASGFWKKKTYHAFIIWHRTSTVYAYTELSYLQEMWYLTLLFLSLLRMLYFGRQAADQV